MLRKPKHSEDEDEEEAEKAESDDEEEAESTNDTPKGSPAILNVQQVQSIVEKVEDASSPAASPRDVDDSPYDQNSPDLSGFRAFLARYFSVRGLEVVILLHLLDNLNKPEFDVHEKIVGPLRELVGKDSFIHPTIQKIKSTVHIRDLLHKSMQEAVSTLIKDLNKITSVPKGVTDGKNSALSNYRNVVTKGNVTKDKDNGLIKDKGISILIANCFGVPFSARTKAGSKMLVDLIPEFLKICPLHYEDAIETVRRIIAPTLENIDDSALPVDPTELVNVAHGYTINSNWYISFFIRDNNHSGWISLIEKTCVDDKTVANTTNADFFAAIAKLNTSVILWHTSAHRALGQIGTQDTSKTELFARLCAYASKESKRGINFEFKKTLRALRASSDKIDTPAKSKKTSKPISNPSIDMRPAKKAIAAAAAVADDSSDDFVSINNIAKRRRIEKKAALLKHESDCSDSDGNGDGDEDNEKDDKFVVRKRKISRPSASQDAIPGFKNFSKSPAVVPVLLYKHKDNVLYFLGKIASSKGMQTTLQLPSASSSGPSQANQGCAARDALVRECGSAIRDLSLINFTSSFELKDKKSRNSTTVMLALIEDTDLASSIGKTVAPSGIFQWLPLNLVADKVLTDNYKHYYDITEPGIVLNILMNEDYSADDNYSSEFQVSCEISPLVKAVIGGACLEIQNSS